MDNITNEMRKKYVDNGGLYCPFCNSKNINVGNSIWETDFGSATVMVTCDDCKKRWEDLYALQGIRNAE